jgi:UDP-N-acetylmuramate dehydrogenase
VTVLDAVARDLERRLPGRVTRDAPSAPLTTYRVGGPLAVLVRVDDDDELLAVSAAVVAAHHVPLLVIGRGSNLLVADTGFAGVAVVLGGHFHHWHAAAADDHPRVEAGGAVALPVLARGAAARGVGGLEFYVGIPGSVGGAVRMNAGGHGRETRDVIESARILDLETAAFEDWGVDRLDLGYRCSAVGQGHVVAAATFAGYPRDPEASAAEIAEIVRWRRDHQPGGSNAGSVFANPPGDTAGRLVDACGLKGLRVGGAVVSEKHANFVQAEQGATASDVHALVGEVRRRVRDLTGVDLRPELRFVGFAP